MAYAGKGHFLLETKRLYTRVEIKAVDTTERLITGHAAAVGNQDRVGDVIEKGAFDRTLKANPDVLVFIGHDASRLPVGEPSSMAEDYKGLLTTTKVYNTPAGDELLEVAKQRMQSGRTLGMSIGYRVAPGGSKMVRGVRHLSDIDLLEYSFLASPMLAANPEATMTGVKGRRKAFGGTSTVEESYEDLQSDLREAARAALPGMWVHVAATYPDHVIVCCEAGYASDGPMTPSESDTDEESQYWDFPYTLGADGEPTLGTPKPVQPAFVPGAAKDHIREQRKLEQPQRSTATVDLNSLPDSAFAFVEPGGAKDDEQKTVPRATRHFAHHAADGTVDLDLLRDALHEAEHSEHGSKAFAHLTRHAIKIGVSDPRSGGIDDAHAAAWSEGAAPRLMVVAAKLAALAEDVAADRSAMERLGLDTKNGDRLNSAMRLRLKDLHASLEQILEWADSIDRGEDGKARVDLFRHKLAMLELSEVS